jgi:hypothetical protein
MQLALYAYNTGALSVRFQLFQGGTQKPLEVSQFVRATLPLLGIDHQHNEEGNPI